MATYGVLVWSFLVELVGSLVSSNHWFLDTSCPPDGSRTGRTGELDGRRSAGGDGAAAVLAGGVAFRRRDLVELSEAMAKRAAPKWRERFVEEFGVLSMEMGTSRAMARIIAWMLVCDPPEQSSKDLQAALLLSPRR